MNDSTIQCRFCLEDDTQTNLIVPCLCKGSAKYVHESCLSKWYEKKPESGYKCSSCMFIYKRSYPKEYEIVKNIYTFQIPYISTPFLCILFHHWVFFLGTRTFFSERNYKILLYIIHGLLNIVYYFYCIYVFMSIQNKKQYIKLWFKNIRFMIHISQLYFLITIPVTGWLGGFSSCICMYLCVFEHSEILQIMNKNHVMRFIDYTPS
jgi:hypothetical protein